VPIPVECPGCGARLNAPDAGAGKQVRCPKPHCGELIPVPALIAADEVVDHDPPRPARRDDRPRRSDDRDRPRRSRDDDRAPRHVAAGRPRSRRGPGTAAIVAIALASVLALAGIGYGVYAALGGGKATAPPDWNEYVYADDGFKAYFPKEPKVRRTAEAIGRLPGLDGAESSADAVTSYDAGGADDPVRIEVVVYRFPAGVPAPYRDPTRGFAAAAGGKKEFGFEMKSVRWMGERAAEVTTPTGVTRVAVTGKALYKATISGRQFARATPDDEKAFFDNFVPAR
jgi:hypothetical protein